MPRKKKEVDLTKNQALRDVLPYYKNAQELANKIGLTKQSISIVRNDHQPIFDSIIVYIKKNHPDIALKYWGDEMIFNQESKPNIKYKLQKMERFESELRLLMDVTHELRQEVRLLKNEINQLKSDSEQSQEAI